MARVSSARNGVVRTSLAWGPPTIWFLIFLFHLLAGDLTIKVNVELPDRLRKINDKLNVSKHAADVTGEETN